MMKAKRLGESFADETGAGAVEFALVLPAFVTLILGMVFGAQVMFEASSLRNATEAAARCASVQTTVCSSNATIQTYAVSKYFGPVYPAPTFVASTATCGHKVTGSATYILNTGMATFNIPLSANACFP